MIVVKLAWLSEVAARPLLVLAATGFAHAKSYDHLPPSMVSGAFS